jgi:hypothetical protein
MGSILHAFIAGTTQNYAEGRKSVKTPAKSGFEKLRIPLVAGWRDLGEMGGGITARCLVGGGGITLQQWRHNSAASTRSGSSSVEAWLMQGFLGAGFYHLSLSLIISALLGSLGAVVVSIIARGPELSDTGDANP